MFNEPMNGRVSVFKGEIFYSPNSSRDLLIHRGTAAPSNAREFQNPRWWAASTEWLAFVPRLPVAFSGVFFEALAHAPQGIAPTTPYGYILPGNILPLWLAIEDTLDKVIRSLCTLNQLRPKLPFPPRQFGYGKMHETEGEALAAMAESRDWFSLWIGLLYWAMRKTQVADAGDEVEGGAGPPKWFTQLAGVHCNQALLDNLLTEPLLQKSSTVDRVGVVLHFPDEQRSQPPVAWFVSMGIPIWYRWGAREAKAAGTQLPIPPISQLQEATTLLVSSPQPPSIEVQMPQTEQPGNNLTNSAGALATQDCSAKAVLQAFFRKREIYSMAKTRQRRKRIGEREIIEDPVKSPPPVYVWDWDPEAPTVFSRMLVPQDKSGETLAEYADYQKRYDPFLNEWDCCRMWDPEVPKDIGNKETGNLPVEIIQDDIAETTILNLLRLHFGFVPPLPLPEITANPSLDDCRNPQLLIDALGLISITASAPFFQKPLLQICIQFVQNFLANQSKKPYDDEWDLSPFNRLSLASCSRLEKVRPVKKNDGSNFRMYMFDFGDEATVPWNLAVCSSTMVLYICRLDGEMRERDIALELLRFGLPFRTFQRADTFADISEAHSLADKTLFPITTSSDTLACNWYKYKEHRHSILQQSRCARAALQAGGFVWRITRDEVDINEALAGPSGRYTNSGFTLSVWDDQGIEYVDDKLTTSETGVILGHYRGISTKCRKHVNYFFKPGFPGWWTERLEQFYTQRVELAIRKDDSREHYLHLQSEMPSPPPDRGRNQPAKGRIQTWSDEFLAKHLRPPSHPEQSTSQ